jgi:hypothetical protein
MCKFNFLPSKELAEEGPFDGFLIVEIAHRTQTTQQRPNQPFQSIIGTNPFQPPFR